MRRYRFSTRACGFRRPAGNTGGTPSFHRVAGELLVARGAAEPEAEARFRRALAIAQAQQAKMLELRAAVSVGRLLQRGEREHARRLVEGVYGWFTEGFESPELIRARALLAEHA